MPDKFGDKIRLQHALDAIKALEGYVGHAEFDAFLENSMMQDACIRQLQVVGEACRNISPDLRGKYTDIPWHQIVGLRIIVIHEYFGLDEKIVWDIIQNDLPTFKIQLETILVREGL